MIYSLCPRRKTIRQTTHSTRPWRCSIFAPAESCSAGLHINCYASICSNTYLLLLVTFEAETPLSAMLFWMVSRSRCSRILNEIFPWALTGAPLIQSELVSTSPAKCSDEHCNFLGTVAAGTLQPRFPHACLDSRTLVVALLQKMLFYPVFLFSSQAEEWLQVWR